MRPVAFIPALAVLLASCAPSGPPPGAVEEVVAMQRAELYAELNAQVTALEQAVKAKPTQTGTPPVPVEFEFAHDQDRHLLIHAQAAFREVALELWLQDGDDPGHTKLSAREIGMSGAEGIVKGNVRLPVETRLDSAIADANDGTRITALFGKSPHED